MILFQVFSKKTKKNRGGAGGCPNESGEVGKFFEVKFKKLAEGWLFGTVE